MNPFQFRVTCDVCGGDASADSNTAAAAWDSRYRIRHSRPEHCAAVLENKRRELEARELAWEQERQTQ